MIQHLQALASKIEEYIIRDHQLNIVLEFRETSQEYTGGSGTTEGQCDSTSRNFICWLENTRIDVPKRAPKQRKRKYSSRKILKAHVEQFHSMRSMSKTGDSRMAGKHPG